MRVPSRVRCLSRVAEILAVTPPVARSCRHALMLKHACFRAVNAPLIDQYCATAAASAATSVTKVENGRRRTNKASLMPYIRCCLRLCVSFKSRLSIFADVCVLPAESGPCEAAIRRWFYNPRSRQCRRFTYGGCEGNGNNFETKAACEARCSNEGELLV